LNAEETSALIRGTIVAAEILDRAGVEPKSICTTPVRGAHPGGTAAIGKVVNSNLETEVEGLFVADASVIPITPGGPPMLTIMALAKRLAKRITREF
jgi:choline dehydrogenase-like flavoprotein